MDEGRAVLGRKGAVNHDRQDDGLVEIFHILIFLFINLLTSKNK